MPNEIRKYIENMSDEEFQAILDETEKYPPVTILLPDGNGGWVDPLDEILSEDNKRD